MPGWRDPHHAWRALVPGTHQKFSRNYHNSLRYVYSNEGSIAVELGITDVSHRITESKYRDPESRELEGWAGRDAKSWEAALNSYLDDVTANLLDDVFLHIEEPGEIVYEKHGLRKTWNKLE